MALLKARPIASQHVNGAGGMAPAVAMRSHTAAARLFVRLLYYYTDTAAMLLQLDKRGGVPVYRQIVDQVRHRVVSGRLAPGEQLASVRDLAAALEVNPMTVSKAYGLLEQAGLVERRAGVGYFVANGGGARKAERIALLEPALARAASEAHQLHVAEPDALAAFSKLYRRLDREEER